MPGNSFFVCRQQLSGPSVYSLAAVWKQPGCHHNHLLSFINTLLYSGRECPARSVQSTGTKKRQSGFNNKQLFTIF